MIITPSTVNMSIMGHRNISTLAVIVSLVLFFQLALHTQLLQRQPEVIELDNSSVEASSPKPTELALSSSTNLRYKRFLQKHSSDENVPDKVETFATTTPKFESFEVIEEMLEKAVVYDDNDRNSSVDVWSGVLPNYTISNFYTGRFVSPRTNLCSGKRRNLSLVVLVPSAVSNFQQRETVRKTWGAYANRRDVVIGFIIGNPALSKTNETVLESFQQENDLFGDIIVADMKDSYQNLTLKVLFMLEWVSTHCKHARFMMKTDDDVFLNIPLVLQLIDRIQESDAKRPKIYGNVFGGHLPQRNITHKHHVNYTVYPHDIPFPNFTSGPSYMVSSRVLRPLLKQAVRLPLFNLEDVFLTGFVASSLSIPRIKLTQFRNELENPFNMPACRLINTIAGMTDGSPSQMYYVWYNYLIGRQVCKYLKPR